MPDQIRFKFSQGTKNVRQQFSTPGLPVDGLLGAAKANPFFLERVNGLDQLLDRAPQSIQLPDHQSITCPQNHFGIFQCRSHCFAATGNIREDFVATDFFERLDLQIWALRGGRDSGIANQYENCPTKCALIRSEKRILTLCFFLLRTDAILTIVRFLKG